MTPHDEAAAILSHYFRSLSRAAGVRWTAQNDADMQRVADLLSDGDYTEIPAFDPIETTEQSAAAPTARPTHRLRSTPRRGGITQTTPVDDKTWLRNLAATNGIDTTRAQKGGK